MVGNIPKFNRYDVVRCFLRITKDVPRIKLVEETQLGEGTVRTILDILKGKKLIDSTRQGHCLTKEGEELANRIRALLEYRQFNDKKTFPQLKKMAFCMKLKRPVKIGYKERDEALKNGADAALLFFYRDGLKMLELDDFDTSELEKLYKFCDNNLLLITASQDQAKAEQSGIAVAEEIMPELKKIINNFCRNKP